MTHQPYPYYKPSGVDWLGDIPDHWEVKKLKYLVKSEKDDIPQGPLRIAVENIESRTGRLVNLPEDLSVLGDAAGFKSGDVIFNKLRPYLAKVYYTNHPGGCLGELLILRSKGELHGKYSYYRLLSDEFISKVNSSTEGTKMPRASWDDFMAHLKIAIPPLAEQTAIARYLDRETARLDTLMAQKRQLISLLQEERAGLINQVVTQGLDFYAPRQDSGLAWLGQIPAHWEVKKLKYVLSIQSGDSLVKENFVQDGQYPVFGGNGVMGYTDNFNSEKLLLVIGRVGAKCGNVRLVAGKKWVSDNALRVVTTENYSFMEYSLQAIGLNRLANSSAQPLLTATLIKDQVISLPSLAEQADIVAYLDRETARIDATIQTVEQELGLLAEYRSALISEVVTGKVRVTDTINH